jgi:hypothetical protein
MHHMSRLFICRNTLQLYNHFLIIEPGYQHLIFQFRRILITFASDLKHEH